MRGNPGKRPLPAGEPRPARELPQPPAFLGAEGLAEWARLAPELHRIGVLTMADRANLAAYCKLYERWATAEAMAGDALTTTTANGFVVQNPYIGIANRAVELMLKYMLELGLTPASRTKIQVGEPSVDDPLEQFLTRKRGRR